MIPTVAQCVSALLGLSILIWLVGIVIKKPSTIVLEEIDHELKAYAYASKNTQSRHLFIVIGLIVLYSSMILGSVWNSPSSSPTSISFEALVSNIVFQMIVPMGIFLMMRKNTSLTKWFGVEKAYLRANWKLVLKVVAKYFFIFILLLKLTELSGYFEWLQSYGFAKEQASITIVRGIEDPILLVLMIFSVSVMAPLSEEIVFRGLIYPVMGNVSSRRIALVASSMFFAVIHADVTSFLSLCIMAIAMVKVYDETQTLVAPILFHMGWNSFTLFMILFLK